MLLRNDIYDWRKQLTSISVHTLYQAKTYFYTPPWLTICLSWSSIIAVFQKSIYAFIVSHTRCSLCSMPVLWGRLSLEGNDCSMDSKLRISHLEPIFQGTTWRRDTGMLWARNVAFNAEQLSCHIKALSRFKDPRNYVFVSLSLGYHWGHLNGDFWLAFWHYEFASNSITVPFFCCWFLDTHHKSAMYFFFLVAPMKTFSTSGLLRLSAKGGG